MDETIDVATFAGRTLLVCAGSNPGRTPFAMVPRVCGRTLRRDGNRIWFESPRVEGASWRFEVVAADEHVALTIETGLANEEIYSTYADGERVRSIIFMRDDWGEEPRWIGGDISLAGVDAGHFLLNGNKAYYRRETV